VTIRIVIGIDPGLASLGLALIERGVREPWRLLFSQTVRTSPGLDLHSRMREGYAALQALPVEPFRGAKPHEVIVACEDQAGVLEGKRRAGETNASAMLVQQVVGMARVKAFGLGVKFVEVTPAQAKAVLSGIPRTASKAQVQRAVRAVVRDCPKVMSEHASDAIAVALAGARMVR
jgi:Holliday junction resolvasome RuvABC endonuclease subunit